MIPPGLLAPPAVAFILGLVIGVLVPDKLGRLKLRHTAVWAINRLPGKDVSMEDMEEK